MTMRNDAFVLAAALLAVALSSVSAHAQALDQLAVAARHAPASRSAPSAPPPSPECRPARNTGAVIGGVIGLGVGIALAAQFIRKARFPGLGRAFAPVIVFLPAVGGTFIGAGVGELVCEGRG